MTSKPKLNWQCKLTPLSTQSSLQAYWHNAMIFWPLPPLHPYPFRTQLPWIKQMGKWDEASIPFCLLLCDPSPPLIIEENSCLQCPSGCSIVVIIVMPFGPSFAWIAIIILVVIVITLSQSFPPLQPTIQHQHCHQPPIIDVPHVHPAKAGGFLQEVGSALTMRWRKKFDI